MDFHYIRCIWGWLWVPKGTTKLYFCWKALAAMLQPKLRIFAPRSSVVSGEDETSGEKKWEA